MQFSTQRVSKERGKPLYVSVEIYASGARLPRDWCCPLGEIWSLCLWASATPLPPCISYVCKFGWNPLHADAALFYFDVVMAFSPFKKPPFSCFSFSAFTLRQLSSFICYFLSDIMIFVHLLCVLINNNYLWNCGRHANNKKDDN